MEIEGLNDPPPHHYISVDPGRRNLISALILSPDRKIIGRVVLSRAQYYQQGGMNDRQRRAKKKNNDPRRMQVNTAFSENHFKTADINSLLAAFQTMNTHHLLMFMVRGKQKYWARQDFLAHQMKASVLDNTLNKFDDVVVDGQRSSLIEVLFEDGRFASGGRGEKYVP